MRRSAGNDVSLLSQRGDGCKKARDFAMPLLRRGRLRASDNRRNRRSAAANKSAGSLPGAALKGWREITLDGVCSDGAPGDRAWRTRFFRSPSGRASQSMFSSRIRQAAGSAPRCGYSSIGKAVFAFDPGKISILHLESGRV